MASNLMKHSDPQQKALPMLFGIFSAPVEVLTASVGAVGSVKPCCAQLLSWQHGGSCQDVLCFPQSWGLQAPCHPLAQGCSVPKPLILHGIIPLCYAGLLQAIFVKEMDKDKENAQSFGAAPGPILL